MVEQTERVERKRGRLIDENSIMSSRAPPGGNVAMRIAVDARTCLVANPRGEGKSILRLYQEIAALRPGWELVFYGDRPDAPFPAALPAGNVKAFELPGFRFSSWENLGFPARTLVDRITIAHYTSSSAPPFSPVPFVVTVHDVIPLVFPDGWPAVAVRKFGASVLRAVRHARAVIVPSANTKADLLRITGAAAERVHVIPWGSDALATPMAADERDRLLQSARVRRPFVLAFGGGAPRKNTEATLRGFAAVAGQIPELNLVLAGLGTDALRGQYRALASELGLGERVCVLEYVSEPLLEALYAGARCLLYLSSYEGFGLPVLEAMARGLPVIGANLTSIPEVAGDAAMLFDPVDTAGWTAALVELCASDALHADLEARGRVRAQRFSWAETGRATVELFERVVG
jgi:glycosyltransferase involved in cell wall biosynthesis